MSGYVDIRSALRAALAIAAFAILLSVPAAQAAENECAAAGSDPTAAQYCTTPEIEVESETASGGGGGGNNNTPTSTTTPVAETEVQPAAAESVAGTSGGSLPFTGEDLLALGAVAAAFVAVGLALQRLSRGRAEPR